MKTTFTLLAAAALAGLCSAQRLTLNGAGASFPAPVYQLWAYSYTQSNEGAAVNYTSVGSGAGIQQIKQGTVDFAGTDAPLTTEQCEEAGLVQFPMLTGAVTPVVNLPRIKAGKLRLSNATLAALFLGDITHWDDPRIVAENPGLKLPKGLPVTVVHRADSSGTSFVYTSYLAGISADWKEKVGAGASVKWPVGIGGQKNPGVCNSVAKIRGAIGYTELTYALEAKLATVQLQDKAGAWCTPDAATWPILGTTYLLMRKDTPAAKAEALKAYFRWCFKEGGAQAVTLHYAPLSASEQKAVLEGALK